jgi:tRNA(fMet)-specific endonuclease VapC
MSFLLDTDICVYWLRGDDVVRKRLAQAGLTEVSISIITLAELYYGADCSANAEANRQAVDVFAKGISLIGISYPSADIFARTKAGLRKAGMLIEDLDLLIAATALAHDLTLVTNNTEHFKRIPDLKLEYWREQN